MKITGTAEEVHNKVNEFLENNVNAEEFICIISTKLTKEMRTTLQNNMFYWLFTEIWNHLWVDKEDVKDNFLKWLFGIKTVQLWMFESEEANIKHTSDLDITQAIFFIESIQAFIEKYWVPCKYTSREFESLIKSYK